MKTAWNGSFGLQKHLWKGCATFFVGGPYNKLQTCSWATRKI